MTPPPSVDVTISIATFDRPDGLERTLRSCLSQRNALGLSYEILVTDNHPSGNGEPVVRAFPDAPIRYQRNLTRNMSVLRNAGIKAARGAYVAFIDDDEFAEPGWLDGLMGAIRAVGADIAIGPRRAVFAGGAPPPYDPAGRSFERVYDLPDHAPIALTDPGGRPRYGLGTGNSLICAATCLAAAEPFDPAFGDAGGEDIEFFMRQHRAGRRLVWAAAAQVTELVPQRRTTVAYRLVRARRETQIFVSTYMAHAARPRRTLAWLMLTGLVQTAAGAALAALSLEFGSPSRLWARHMLTKGLAKLGWRRPVGYIDETTFKPAARS